MDFAKLGKEKRYNLFPELLDLHILRMLEAHRRIDTYMKDSSLLHSGMLMFNNLLGKETAEKIKQEIGVGKIKDGLSLPTLLAMQKGEAVKAKAPLWDLVMAQFKQGMTKRVKRLFDEQTYLQHLKNEPDDGDDQKVFHTDTFFPCVKFWYFPHSVSVNEGPFWYVPYSPEVTYKLLDWHRARVEDLKAGKAEEWRGQGHKEGSFRISPQEIKELGLQETPVTVQADTLVIANVFGFHKRGDVKESTHRMSIHGSIRFDPFN